jgi:Dihydrofolate reductase
VPGGTTSSSSGFGAALNTRRCIYEPTTASATPVLRLAAHAHGLTRVARLRAKPLAARILVTYIHRAVEGDTYFPAIDGRIWQEIARDEQAAAVGDDTAFAYVTYERAS